jgi:hypothetical protein
MLSTATTGFLDELCTLSHAAYPEGGTLWTYVEALNQAHSRFDHPRDREPHAPLDPEQLARWIQWAQGDRKSTKPESVDSANRLMALLREDLTFDEVHWTLSDHGSDMKAVLHMARRRDNRYFALELFWSED